MKNHIFFHRNRASRIPGFFRPLKRAVLSLRLRIVMAVILMMMLTVTIQALEEVVVQDSKRTSDKNAGDLETTGFDASSLGRELKTIPAVSMKTEYPKEGVPWKYAFSGQAPPEGIQTAMEYRIMNGDIPTEDLEACRSTDSPAARFRLLSGATLNFYDDAHNPIYSLGTGYYSSDSLGGMCTGKYFDDTRPFKIDAGLRSYMTERQPQSYIGLPQPLVSEDFFVAAESEADTAREDPFQDIFANAAGRSTLIIGDYSHMEGKPTSWSRPSLKEVFKSELETGSETEPLKEYKMSQEAWEYAFGNLTGLTEWPSQDEINRDPILRGIGDRPPSEAMSLWDLAALIQENIWRQVQETEPVVPNDPLFSKKDSELKKAASGVAKAFGSILKLGGGGISVGESPGESTKPSNQWGLHKVGFTPRADPQSAWNIEDGSRKNVVVAVIDSGLDLTHPDGPQFLWTNAGEIADNKIDDDANGYVDDIHGWNFFDENNDITDYYGHGTFVTGIIAAKTNNGEGIAGIDPGAQIMTLKATNKRGRAHSLAIYRAIRYAVDNGARVINISLAGKGISRLEQIGVNYAYAQGCLVVISSGNQGGDVAEYGPPGVRRAFAVAAINVDGKRRGTANSGANVALTAPGEHIYSLTAKEGKKDGQITPVLGTTYHTLTGTSFSAPMVAATASLIWAKNPNLTNRQVEDRLLDTAEDLDRTGWDRYNGAGLLNASRALRTPEVERLTVRFTEVFANTSNKKIASLDVYGIVRGDLDSYVVELGKGREPDKWEQVFGPSKDAAEYGHICRIENELLQKGRDWTVRISAKSKSGKTRTASLWVKKK